MTFTMGSIGPGGAPFLADRSYLDLAPPRIVDLAERAGLAGEGLIAPLASLVSASGVGWEGAATSTGLDVLMRGIKAADIDLSDLLPEDGAPGAAALAASRFGYGPSEFGPRPDLTGTAWIGQARDRVFAQSDLAVQADAHNAGLGAMGAALGSPAETGPTCLESGAGVCGRLCPRQNDVQPNVANARIANPGFNWDAMNISSLFLSLFPIQIRSASDWRVFTPQDKAPPAAAHRAAHHSIIFFLGSRITLCEL